MLPDYTQAVRTFRAALSDAGLYDGSERRLVLHEFWHAGRPVTLDELHEMVALYPISTTTISRTMELLLSCGLARELEPQKPSHCWNCGCQELRVDENRWRCNECYATGYLERKFAPVEPVCAHVHLVCRDCGAVIEQPLAKSA